MALGAALALTSALRRIGSVGSGGVGSGGIEPGPGAASGPVSGAGCHAPGGEATGEEGERDGDERERHGAVGKCAKAHPDTDGDRRGDEGAHRSRGTAGEAGGGDVPGDRSDGERPRRHCPSGNAQLFTMRTAATQRKEADHDGVREEDGAERGGVTVAAGL